MASIVQGEWRERIWPEPGPPATLTPESRLRPAQGFFLGMGLGIGVWIGLAAVVWLVVL